MNIGFIGLGRMGRGMALNLLRSGHQLHIFDISAEACGELETEGARRHRTPAELARNCEVVFTSLPGPAEVKAVALGPDGLLQHLSRGSVWLDLSTNSPEVLRELADLALTNGVTLLDAPVSGGPAGAASRRLAIWVGGDQDQFTRCLPLLEAMSDQVRYLGPLGSGTTAKLVHNMASTAICAVLGEVMSVGTRAGLDPLVLWETIRTGGAGRMRGFDIIAGRFLPQTFDPPTFALQLARKDMTLGRDFAQSLQVPTPICDQVACDMDAAAARGWAGRDIQSFLLIQSERAGVSPRAVSPDEIRNAMARS